uniref:DeoR family transcriptional regulator n=1 Tax=Anaerotruncus colihominis TaxID=169435 RepID=UPI002942EA27
MLKDERLKEIETMLQTNGKVEVGNLCRIFNVTEMTIRRDLNDLVARNLAVGGHRRARAAPETNMTQRP